MRSDKFRVKYITTAPMPLMRINYYIMQKKMKSWFRNWERFFRARGWVYVSSFNEEWRYSSEMVLTLLLLDGQPVIIWRWRTGLSYAKLGGCRNVYNAFWYHTNEASIKYSSIKLINEVNIQSTFWSFLSMVLAVRILGLQRKTKPSTQALNYYSVRFWGLW